MTTEKDHRIYKLVLTGGPCGGKTTGQARLCTFFESLGWKVFRVPEAATLLIGGGVRFAELDASDAKQFQENLLLTMMQIENTFFDLAATRHQNCLIICDRGIMDASAYIDKRDWDEILEKNNLNSIEVRDNRYNQIVHMVSAAQGAEKFYTTHQHNARSEDIALAKELDAKTAAAWIGHPYFDVIDNSTDFENKIIRLISTICQRLNLETGDRLKVTAKKFKFLVKGPLPPDSEFPPFQDFEVIHHYLKPRDKNIQDRVRKRGQNGNYSYIHTNRKHVAGQTIEVKKPLTVREYEYMLSQLDPHHFEVKKLRRCFLMQNQYFQMDIYQAPQSERCKGLVLMETYSSLEVSDLEKLLPPFLKDVLENVTGNPEYSMFNLSLRDHFYDDKFYKYSITGNKLQPGGEQQPEQLDGTTMANGGVANDVASNHAAKSYQQLNGGGHKSSHHNGGGLMENCTTTSNGSSSSDRNNNDAAKSIHQNHTNNNTRTKTML